MLPDDPDTAKNARASQPLPAADDEYIVYMGFGREAGVEVVGNRPYTDLRDCLRTQCMDWNGDHWQRSSATVALLDLKGAIVEEDPRTDPQLPLGKTTLLLQKLEAALSAKGLREYRYLNAGVARMVVAAKDNKEKEMVVTLKTGEPADRTHVPADLLLQCDPDKRGIVTSQEGETIGYEILKKLDTRVSLEEARAFVNKMAAKGYYVTDDILKPYGYGESNPGVESGTGNLGKDENGTVFLLDPDRIFKGKGSRDPEVIKWQRHHLKQIDQIAFNIRFDEQIGVPVAPTFVGEVKPTGSPPASDPHGRGRLRG